MTINKSVKIREFFEKGRQAERQEAYDEALRFYEKVLTLDANHTEALDSSTSLKAKISSLRAESHGKGEPPRVEIVSVAIDGQLYYDATRDCLNVIASPTRLKISRHVQIRYIGHDDATHRKTSLSLLD